MRIKSNLLCGIVGTTALIASPSAFASFIGTGSLYITAPGYFATGDQAGPYSVSSLTPLTGANPGSSFTTFCLGSQVDYYPGTTYNYQISDSVQPTSGVGAPGYVTWGTAWLYSQYRDGLLGGGAGVNNPANDALQEAFWTLQNQSLSGVYFTPDQTAYSNYLSEASAAAAAAHLSSDEVDANGAFGVYALNLCSGSGNNINYYQPQLCMVPVPEPSTYVAGAMMLLPFGASALRIVRKRLA